MRSLFATVLVVPMVAIATAWAPATAIARKPGAARGDTAHRSLIRVDRAPDGRGVQVNIELIVDAPVDAVERMVRDVERWPDWIPNMKQVRPVVPGAEEAPPPPAGASTRPQPAAPGAPPAPAAAPAATASLTTPMLHAAVAAAMLGAPAMADAGSPALASPPPETSVAAAAPDRRFAADAGALAPAGVERRAVADIPVPTATPTSTNAAAAAATRAGAEREFETLLALPWPVGNVRERLLLKRSASGNSVKLAWSQIRGDLRRDEGSWVLSPRGRRATRVVYQANIQLGVWLPMFLVRRAGEKSAPRFIENMRRRAIVVGGPISSI